MSSKMDEDFFLADEDANTSINNERGSATDIASTTTQP